jgi:DNA repair protein RecN (Recombination protein N)
MLAIKSVTAQVDVIDTMIFDEIDSGISGMTAGLVGEKLSDVAKKHQIIAITHLPQIASMADNHFKVLKSSNEKGTAVNCVILEHKETTQEIGRLLGGKNITEVVISNAREMLEIADSYKKNR